MAGYIDSYLGTVKASGQTGRQTGRQAGSPGDRQAGRHTGRTGDRQSGREIGSDTVTLIHTTAQSISTHRGGN